jgi:alpha-glucosidase (family GH31 glycosyl hydrolase)
VFNNATLTKSTVEVYGLRYMILPHIYTLLYEAHIYGGSVNKALFFESVFY